MNSINVIITSYTDQPGLVAEVWCELGMVAAVRYHDVTKLFEIEFFTIKGEERPTFDLAAWEFEITKAKRRILEIEGPPSPRTVQDNDRNLVNAALLKKS